LYLLFMKLSWSYNMDREFARLTRIDFVHFFISFFNWVSWFFYLFSIMLFIFHDSDHEFDKLTQSIFLIPFQLNFFFNLTLQQLHILLIFFLIIIISCLGILCHIYSIQIHANEARNIDSCQWTLTLAWLILC
jgi:hypothetical protein